MASTLSDGASVPLPPPLTLINARQTQTPMKTRIRPQSSEIGRLALYPLKHRTVGFV